MMSVTLINGLWQGALVAAIATLITTLLPQRHAATRYAVWFTALVALAILPFVGLWHPAPTFAALPVPMEHTAVATSLVTAKAASASGTWLVLVWLVGVTFCLIRLGLSHARIKRIVRDAKPAPEFGGGVMISDDVAIPVAAGFFAPVVIIPTKVLAMLERRDVESIVQHERAHIARMDILGNLIQRVIEAFLFFNPWAYVIGRQLIKEREAACDDWAVQTTGEPDRYASCLAKLAQGAQHTRTPLLTPSAIGSRRMLVGRIARLLNGKATQLKVNYFVLAASVMAFTILAVLLQTSTSRASIENVTLSRNVVASANSCVFPHGYADVKALNPVPPNIPKSAYRPNLSANALVTVGPDGLPIKAKIVKSSGSAAVDRATIDAAMHSTYSPKMKACKPMTGEYLFNVDTGA